MTWLALWFYACGFILTWGGMSGRAFWYIVPYNLKPIDWAICATWPLLATYGIIREACAWVRRP